jgi:hypothetical protein
MQLRWMRQGDQQGFLNYVGKRISILEDKWTRKIQYLIT